MARTKIKYENQQRAITQKIRNAEYRFLCTALFLNEIYHPMKYENKQRAITQKLRSEEYRSLCTALRVIERS
jgi:hypothetical protein